MATLDPVWATVAELSHAFATRAHGGAMARLSLTLLGGFQARSEPGSPVPIPTRKAQALLAYLALPLGQAHPRDKLAALLWGDLQAEPARNNVRQTLFELRKGLTTVTPGVWGAVLSAVRCAAAHASTRNVRFATVS